MGIRKYLSPALALLFLSPAIGELLSGSAPPAEFFNPLGFIMLVVLYGGGAILARELTHRWGKGWPTLLALGAAYGIAEEGLICKSFFDPSWMDLGALGSYGRWIGVNWVWSLELTIYHCVFSIAIPILLAGILFPTWRDRSWISRRKLITLAILWAANGLFIFLFISPYRPAASHYLLTLVIMVGLGVLAWQLPHPKVVINEESSRAARAFWFLPVGFVGTLALFFLVWVVPKSGIHPLLTMSLMTGLVILVGWIVLRMSGGGAWTERHQLSLVAGALGFFILLAPLQELDKNRTDNTTGMTIVGLMMAIFLILLMLRIRNQKWSTVDEQTGPN